MRGAEGPLSRGAGMRGRRVSAYRPGRGAAAGLHGAAGGRRWRRTVRTRLLAGRADAAVAAEEGALSLGTDTAGSIRQPAAFCGVVGMKPSYGRVSRYGLIAFGSSLDCPGPIARNVKDAALMLQVIAGADRADATAAVKEVPDYLRDIEKGVKGMRIGLSPDYFRITFPDRASGEYTEQPLPQEMRQAVYRAAEIYREMGAEIIEDVPMPNTRFGIPVFFVISRVEAASNLHRFDGV